MYACYNYLYTRYNYLYTRCNYLYTRYNNLFTSYNYLHTRYNYLYTRHNYIYRSPGTNPLGRVRRSFGAALRVVTRDPKPKIADPKAEILSIER